MGTSLLLHCLAAVSLALAARSGGVTEGGRLAVHLAVSSSVPERSSAAPDLPARRVVSELQHPEPVQRPTGSPPQAVPGPVVEPVPEAVEKVPLPERETRVPVGIPDDAAVEMPAASPPDSRAGSDASAGHPPAATDDPPDAMLAFAGDPAALGLVGAETLGEALVKARILSLPEPAYPVLSRKRGEEGRVVLKVTIGADGGVRGAEIFSSSSFERLDRAALKAVRGARFSPATEYGIPVESDRRVAYRFELKR